MSIGHLLMVSLDFPFGDEGIDIIGPQMAKTFRLHPFLPCIRSQELLSQEVWAFY